MSTRHTAEETVTRIVELLKDNPKASNKELGMALNAAGFSPNPKYLSEARKQAGIPGAKGRKVGGSSKPSPATTASKSGASVSEDPVDALKSYVRNLENRNKQLGSALDKVKDLVSAL